MSFYCDRDVMKEGDTVILHLGQQNMLTISLKIGESYQTKWGVLRHNDVIGKEFGSKIQCPKGFICALKPTPELWTINLPHRTQILYSTDISVVTMELNLKPGSVVVESGTGSASLSHAIIRTIAPDGHLYTYEFHEQRAKTAEQEFKNHGISEFVTVTHRDVILDGFTIQDKADAVFLDLPNPQAAVQHAKNALKLQGGRLCSFSPCIEQVQKTCLRLTEFGFVEIKTIECLLRLFDVRTCTITKPNMGDMQPLSYSKSGTVGTLNEDGDNIVFKSAVAPSQQPGHTGFLTFATLYAKNTNNSKDIATEVKTETIASSSQIDADDSNSQMEDVS